MEEVYGQAWSTIMWGPLSAGRVRPRIVVHNTKDNCNNAKITITNRQINETTITIITIIPIRIITTI